MKLIIIMILTLSSLNISAKNNCYKSLTNQNTSDSSFFKVSIDDFEYEKESQLERKALDFLLKKQGCDTSKVEAFKCGQINTYEYSYSCTANIQEGYFFVTSDMLDHINIIFNRFD